MDREHSCCFTGHRPSKLPWGDREDDPRCLSLKQRLADALIDAYEQGFRHFLCGMAQGTDLYFCEAILALRRLRGDITVEAAIPFLSQANSWPQIQQQRYRTLLEQCDFETVVQHQYSPGCLQRRNRYMVDRASLVISAYNGMGGGTMNTLAYAMAQEISVVILDI